MSQQRKKVTVDLNWDNAVVLLSLRHWRRSPFPSPLRLFNGPPKQPSRVGSCHGGGLCLWEHTHGSFCPFLRLLSPDKCPDQAPGTDRSDASPTNEHLLLCSTQTLLGRERGRRGRLCFTLYRPSTEFSIVYESKRAQIYAFAMIYPTARTPH